MIGIGRALLKVSTNIFSEIRARAVFSELGQEQQGSVLIVRIPTWLYLCKILMERHKVPLSLDNINEQVDG